MSAVKTQTLHVSVPNEAGNLAKVLAPIGDAGVDILGYCGWTEPDGGHILIAAEDPVAAASALKQAGFETSAQDVVLVRESNDVGKGAALAKKIADAEVSLQMVLATAAGSEYVTVYQAEDADALLAALS